MYNPDSWLIAKVLTDWHAWGIHIEYARLTVVAHRRIGCGPRTVACDVGTISLGILSPLCFSASYPRHDHTLVKPPGVEVCLASNRSQTTTELPLAWFQPCHHLVLRRNWTMKSTRILTLALLLIVFLILNLRQEPFGSVALNDLETISLLT